jgi:hypothetical protein
VLFFFILSFFSNTLLPDQEGQEPTEITGSRALLRREEALVKHHSDERHEIPALKK